MSQSQLAHVADPAWLAARTSYIGASEAAVALGMSKYKSPTDLWLEKIGEVEADDEYSEAAEIGLLAEDMLFTLYERRTGRRVEKIGEVVRHPRHPFIGCNLDRRAIGEPRLVEGKTAGMTSHGYIDAEWGEDGTSLVPVAYFIQAQMQMEIDDKPVCDMPALLAGRGFRIYTIPRDQALIDNVLLPGLVQFWEYVQNGNPPPLRSMAEVKKRFPQAQAIEVEASADIAHALSDLIAARERAKAAEAEEQRAKDIVAAYMAQCDTLTINGEPVATFKTETRAEHLVRASTTRVLRVKASKLK